MSPQAPYDESDKAKQTNEERLGHQDDSKKTALSKKVYTHRNSVLTDLMEVKHLQTVYNISVAVFNLLLINSALFYIVAPKIFWRDIEIILWATSSLSLFVVMWLCFNAWALLVFQGFKVWVRLRSSLNTKLTDPIFLVLYVALIVFIFTVTTYTVLNSVIRPISHFAIMCEQVRIVMKIYSFVRESAPRVMQYKRSKDGKQEQNIIPSTKHFLYFLFIPAFIYRDSYPQRQAISFWFIGRKLFQFFACIFISYCVFMRFVVDVFRHTGIEPFTLPQAALTLAGAMVVGSMMMFLIFYSILHSWLNVFAELLRFGDREFYQDWWNSTSFSQYYKRWNIVVYDWLYTYVYVESSKLGLSRSASLVLVFLFSALMHEYVIALSLGYFCPVLMITYSTIGITVVFITKEKTSQFWNIFMWSMLFSGWGVIVCLYALEWYARVNCRRTTNQSRFEEFFMPRSWDESCRIIDYTS